MMGEREVDLQEAITSFEARLAYVTELHDTAWARLMAQQLDNRPLNTEILNWVGVCEGTDHREV